MRKKALGMAVVGLVLAGVLCYRPAEAKNPAVDPTSSDLPETTGVYDIVGKPHMKLSVIVHKPNKMSLKQAPLKQCTLSDLESFSIIDPAGWHLPSKWTYQLNTSSAPTNIGSRNFSTLGDLAFGKWNTAAAGKVKFSRGADTKNQKKLDGVNLVAWGQTPSGALAMTYVWFDNDTKLAYEVDTILNKSFIWSWTPYSTTVCPAANSYDSQDILTHEIGHWVGLGDEYESAYVNNTMYGYGSMGEIKKDTLAQGDIAGISLIYP